MFYPRGGRELIVGEDDCAAKVHLPPEGHIWNYIKKQIEPCDVIQRSLLHAEQFWVPTQLPENYRQKRNAERVAQRADPDYTDPDLEAFRSQEWRRRMFGVWFMNNGKMEFITGTHYLFLTYWMLDDGLPEFRIPDRDFFYAWDAVAENPDCAGLILLTKRRQGKTAKSGVIMYDRTSRNRRVRGGIQSKTEDDARDIVFFNGVVMPFLYMVDFFVPKFDKGREWPPKDKIRFFAQGQRGKDVEVEMLDYNDPRYLESWIDYKNSKEKAYDGSKLFTYIGDEVAKTANVDVEKRHYVVRKTLLARDGFTITGKMLYTTTIEEMDATSEKFKNLWDDSDQSNVQNGKRTKSWLWRWFAPAYKTLFYDRYGYPDEERAKVWLMGERDNLRDNPHALATEIRQNPFTWQEAFRSDGDTCLYNPVIINNRLEELMWRKNITRRGDLQWVDNATKKEVKFVENPNGRFYIYQDPDRPNDVKWLMGGNPKPNAAHKYLIGIDPFDHTRTKNGRFSKGAAAVYKRHDPFNKDGDNFVAIYLGRPPHPHMFYEDMIMLCHWYGCQMLFEDQKIGIMHYFDLNRGYKEFMMKNDKGEVGISASTKTHLDIVEETGIFITENGHRTMFSQLLDDWKLFDVDNTEEFDLQMASGYALIGNSRMKLVHDKRAQKKKMDIKVLQRL
jgi:hypothetical protein